MKRTGVLKIIHDTSFPVNKLVIHPNIGFELGLMQVQYTVRLYINVGIEDFKSGTAAPLCEVALHLLNECRDNTVEMSQKLWDQLKKPDRVLLVYDETSGRLFLTGNKK